MLTDRPYIQTSCPHCRKHIRLLKSGHELEPWARRTIEELRAMVAVLERENRRLEREVLALRQLRAAEVDI